MVVVTEAATAGVVMTMAAKAVMKAMGRVGMALIVAAMDCRGGKWHRKRESSNSSSNCRDGGNMAGKPQTAAAMAVAKCQGWREQQ